MKEQSSLYEPLFHFEENFEKERLFSLAKWINGATFKSSDYTKQGLPIIKIAELKNGITNQTRFSNLSEKENYLIKKNDFLFSWSGQPETSIDIFHFAYDEGLLNQHIYKIDPLEIKISKDYFFYLMKYLKKTFIKIARNKQTTGLGHVTKKDLEKITVKFPSNKNDQKSISKILKSIDEKIELNKKNNKTLEEIGKTLFKSWFTNFEPVRAKSEGRSTGLPDEISNLFPASFEDSKLGPIPSGWKLCLSSDLYKVSIGKTPPRKEKWWFSKDKEDIPWLSIKDMGNSFIYALETSEFLTEDAVNKFNIKVVPAETVIVSFKLTVGRVMITPTRMLTNEAIAHFIPLQDSIPTSYSFCLFSNFDFRSLGSTSSIATAVNSKILREMTILDPPHKFKKAFDHLSNPLFQKIKQNLNESKSLEELKNSLLPKLISGELKIPDAKQLIEEVGT